MFDLVDFSGKHVLDIGYGDGRLTWHYTGVAAHITGIEPFEEAIKRAIANQQDTVLDRVEFLNIAFEDFTASSKSELFDIAILSWSL